MLHDYLQQHAYDIVPDALWHPVPFNSRPSPLRDLENDISDPHRPLLARFHAHGSAVVAPCSDNLPRQHVKGEGFLVRLGGEAFPNHRRNDVSVLAPKHSRERLEFAAKEDALALLHQCVDLHSRRSDHLEQDDAANVPVPELPAQHPKNVHDRGQNAAHLETNSARDDGNDRLLHGVSRGEGGHKNATKTNEGGNGVKKAKARQV